MMKLLQKFLFSFILIAGSKVWAAACCGGGISMPALVMGDDQAVLSSSYTYSQLVVDNVDANGFWRRWPQHQMVRTLKLEGAYLLSDRWQAGASVPLIEREYLGERFSGWGDISGNLAYEYLPDWEYHPYRPKGVAFFNLQLPTGKSRSESENGGLDTRGNGFWSLGAGTLLSKNFSRFDVFSNFEVHRSLPKPVRTSQISGTLEPGWGGSFGLGGGYHHGNWRMGSSVMWNYEDPVGLSGSNSFNGAAERYATAALSVSYLLENEWLGVLSYSDQTWIGDPVNTSLSRSVMIQLQRKWLR